METYLNIVSTHNLCSLLFYFPGYYLDCICWSPRLVPARWGVNRDPLPVPRPPKAKASLGGGELAGTCLLVWGWEEQVRIAQMHSRLRMRMHRAPTHSVTLGQLAILLWRGPAQCWECGNRLHHFLHHSCITPDLGSDFVQCSC